MHASFRLGPASGGLSLTVAEWCADGLMTLFFLLVGLEIRREATAGALAEGRAIILPVIAAVGGVLAPAAIYLALNRGLAAQGWSIPTATDVAFTLGILALLGARSPPSLRVFVAALAVFDDILSVLTLAIFYPHDFHLGWLVASGVAVALLFVLNRWRVYVAWPYVMVSAALWLTLNAAGVDAALTGVVLALLLPTRPTPTASVLLAQAATALAALEHAETEAKTLGRNAPTSCSCFPSGTGPAATCRRRALDCSPPPIGSSSRSAPGAPTSCFRCLLSRLSACPCRSISPIPERRACWSA